MASSYINFLKKNKAVVAKRLAVVTIFCSLSYAAGYYKGKRAKINDYFYEFYRNKKVKIKKIGMQPKNVEERLRFLLLPETDDENAAATTMYTGAISDFADSHRYKERWIMNPLSRGLEEASEVVFDDGHQIDGIPNPLVRAMLLPQLQPRLQLIERAGRLLSTEPRCILLFFVCAPYDRCLASHTAELRKLAQLFPTRIFTLITSQSKRFEIVNQEQTMRLRNAIRNG